MDREKQQLLQRILFWLNEILRETHSMQNNLIPLKLRLKRLFFAIVSASK